MDVRAGIIPALLESYVPDDPYSTHQKMGSIFFKKVGSGRTCQINSKKQEKVSYLKGNFRISDLKKKSPRKQKDELQYSAFYFPPQKNWGPSTQA